MYFGKMVRTYWAVNHFLFILVKVIEIIFDKMAEEEK